MKYIYYDPPLKEPNALNPDDDERASLEDIKSLEEEAGANYDYHLADIDYALRFGVEPMITDWTDGPHYGHAALLHGGSTAVLLECLKRNITITKLWKLDDPHGLLSELLSYPGYNNHLTEEERQKYIDLIDRPFSGSYDENIARLKKQREEILEWQRQRKQSQ